MPKVYDKKVTRTMRLDTPEIVEMIRKHYNLHPDASIEVTGEDTSTAESVTISLTNRPLDALQMSTEIHAEEQYQEK